MPMLMTLWMGRPSGLPPPLRIRLAKVDIRKEDFVTLGPRFFRRRGDFRRVRGLQGDVKDRTSGAVDGPRTWPDAP